MRVGFGTMWAVSARMRAWLVRFGVALSMTMEIYANANSTATSEALRRLGGVPAMSTLAVLRCGTGQSRGPTRRTG
jgi:hypothetical protein